MKNPFEVFETEETYEVDGVWQDFGGWRVKLARSGGKNTAYGKMLTDEIKKLGKATFDAVSKEEGDEIIIRVFAKTIIKDHEIKDENGKWKKGVYIKKDGVVTVVPFNSKNMEICLQQLPEYWNKIQSYADDYTVFQREVEKEQVKK